MSDRPQRGAVRPQEPEFDRELAARAVGAKQVVIATNDPQDADRSELAGDWLSVNRVTSTTTDYVGPDEVGWFEFTVRAPAAAGDYRLALRAVVDGVTWLEDDGIFFTIHVYAPKSGRSSLSFFR